MLQTRACTAEDADVIKAVPQKAERFTVRKGQVPLSAEKAMNTSMHGEESSATRCNIVRYTKLRFA